MLIGLKITWATKEHINKPIKIKIEDGRVFILPKPNNIDRIKNILTISSLLARFLNIGLKNPKNINKMKKNGIVLIVVELILITINIIIVNNRLV